MGSTTLSWLSCLLWSIVGIVGVDWVRSRRRHASNKSGDGGNFIPLYCSASQNCEVLNTSRVFGCKITCHNGQARFGKTMGEGPQ